MNPSTDDMLKAIDQVNAETIFILPNNKNIILAANQAKDLVEDKEIIVIPTKTVPQGITAIINFVPDADAKSNEETMLDEIKNVKPDRLLMQSVIHTLMTKRFIRETLWELVMQESFL